MTPWELAIAVTLANRGLPPRHIRGDDDGQYTVVDNYISVRGYDRSGIDMSSMEEDCWASFASGRELAPCALHFCIGHTAFNPHAGLNSARDC